jgi:hypothetical protein
VLTSYRFNTGTAEHFFRSHWSIYTHHRQRSNQRQYEVNVACLDGISPVDFAEGPIFYKVNHPGNRHAAVQLASTLRCIPSE